MKNNIFSLFRMFCESHFENIHEIFCEYQSILKKVTLLLNTLKTIDGIDIDSIYKKAINKSYDSIDSLINDMNELKEMIKSYE